MNIIQLIRRSVASKLILAVVATLLFVIAFYTYLVMDMRGNWLQERLTLSRSLVHASVFEYFVHTRGTHPPDQNERFLAQLAKQAGATSMHLASPDALAETPEGSAGEAPALAEITLSSFGLLGRPAAIAPPPPAEAEHWRVQVPLRGGQYCADCHDVPKDRLMASIMIDYPQTLLRQLQGNDRLRLVKYAALLLLAVLVILIAITWRVVLDPLYRLTHAFARVQQGDQDAVCTIETDDQFGQLASGFNGMLTDIRARQRDMRHGYENQIAHADRLATVGQLASGLAHEIKNPLHSVSAALAILCKRMNDPTMREVGNEMNDQIKRVTRIINDLLRYARPTEPCCTALDLAPLIEKTLCLLRPQAGKQEVNLQAVLDAPGTLVWGDGEKLTQILLNLALNGIQACPSGGNLCIHLHAEGDTCILDVEDTGPGIPAELRERIFQPFFTTKHDGNGLGLAITRTLVEQNGGQIEVLSRPAGGGTCFRIRLPVHRLPDTPH